MWATIERGRDMEDVGAHCEGHNGESVGIAFHGQPGGFSQVQFAALGVLLRDIAPFCRGASLHAHAEFSTKECPGFAVAPLIPLWKKITET
jgi:N-acetylmuramoyl-L-alanine amidase